MEQTHTGYSYQQQGQAHSPASYGPPAGGATTDLYTPTSATGGSSSAPYHTASHSNAASPSPSTNPHSFPPPYASQQPSAYPPPQQIPPPPPGQSSQDAYANHPQYATQQQPQDMARASSSGLQHPSIRASTSTPNTPLSHRTYQQQSLYPAGQQSVGYYPPSAEPPQPRRQDGLRRVRDQRDLRPMISPQPAGRRADPNGTGFLGVRHFRPGLFS